MTGIIDPDTCVIWQGAISSEGYGRIGASQYAHRVAYEEAYGAIPDGLEIDHLCRVRACVNPAHLEAVTRQTNFLRGEHPTAVTVRTNICKRGHSLADAFVRKNGKRYCRTCHNEGQRRRYAARTAT